MGLWYVSSAPAPMGSPLGRTEAASDISPRVLDGWAGAIRLLGLPGSVRTESAGESSEEDCLWGAKQFAAENAVQAVNAKPHAPEAPGFRRLWPGA
jgi:hypothetical protein